MSDESHEYWDAFYADRRSKAVPDQPSAFAEWVAARLEAGQPLVEFGFGNGRDALWFARSGWPVTGFDFASSAVEQARVQADSGGLSAHFRQLDLSDRSATTSVADELARTSTSAAIYGRFLIHSLGEEARMNFFDIAAAALARGGSLSLEFRTGKDREAEHLFGDDHYRVYLDPSSIEDELRGRGASITHSEAGHGLAVFRSEDPHVARIVAEWEQ